MEFSHYYYSDPRRWTVLAGTVRQKPSATPSAYVASITRHPQYDADTSDYDLALMKLSSTLSVDGDSIRPVCLPEYSQSFPDGQTCWITGWGVTSESSSVVPESLQEAKVSLISTSVCNRATVYHNSVTARMVCAGFLAGKIDACQGDSGGPLVCSEGDGGTTFRLVGATSWGEGCARKNQPGVYSRVSSMMEWVYSTMDA
uniref:Transmembrane protease serine 5-like n=1 Tax=Petromyzon marinus TaxID=7757 RepID=A0AAJ7UD67_PETMA|nr:transmembrane protease serine 5-like [Petromyzon marinus]